MRLTLNIFCDARKNTHGRRLVRYITRCVILCMLHIKKFVDVTMILQQLGPWSQVQRMVLKTFRVSCPILNNDRSDHSSSKTNTQVTDQMVCMLCTRIVHINMQIYRKLVLCLCIFFLCILVTVTFVYLCVFICPFFSLFIFISSLR